MTALEIADRLCDETEDQAKNALAAMKKYVASIPEKYTGSWYLDRNPAYRRLFVAHEEAKRAHEKACAKWRELRDNQ